jgi:hypothetical protein
MYAVTRGRLLNRHTRRQHQLSKQCVEVQCPNMFCGRFGVHKRQLSHKPVSPISLCNAVVPKNVVININNFVDAVLRIMVLTFVFREIFSRHAYCM